MSNKKIEINLFKYRKAGTLFLLLFFITLLMVNEVFSDIQESVDNNVDKEEIINQKPEYDDGGKRNPFVPLVTSDGILTHISDEKGDSALYLQGIFYDDKGESMALINDQAVKKNDSIGSAKIVEIKKNSVVYTKNGEIFILNLFREGEDE